MDRKRNDINLMLYADPFYLNRRGASCPNRLTLEFTRNGDFDCFCAINCSIGLYVSLLILNGFYTSNLESAFIPFCHKFCCKKKLPQNGRKNKMVKTSNGIGNTHCCFCSKRPLVHIDCHIHRARMRARTKVIKRTERRDMWNEALIYNISALFHWSVRNQ